MKRYGSMKKQIFILILFILVVMYAPGLLEHSSTIQTITTMTLVIGGILIGYLYLRRKSTL